MISYCDSDFANMWNDLIVSNNKNIVDSNIIHRLHKEIKNLYNINPPEPEFIHYYYWSDGLYVWKPS